MRRLDIATLGHPNRDHPHHRLRAGASLVAALARAAALMLVAFVIVGSVSPAHAAWAFLSIAVLLTVWFSGVWWRWDSPDRRDPNHERERRGF
jgi:hypothetical protein